jgi:hypothetical protein
MRTSIVLSFLTTTLTILSKAVAKPDPNFHVYLAFGQSNMEGAGPIEKQDRIADERYKLLSTVDNCMGRKLGEWYYALPPITSCYGNLSPLDWFGRTLTKYLPEEVTVGIVPVGVAGADIQLFEEENYDTYEQPDWMQERSDDYGNNPYRRLIDMAKIAQKDGVIKGILLHQGETNNGQLDWPERVKAIYEKILKELNLDADEVPLLIGETVSAEVDGLCSAHNEVIKMVPDVIPNSYVISSKGLEHQGDQLHFTSASYRIFGERYADQMLELLCEEEGDDFEINSDEEVNVADDDETVGAEEDSVDEDEN